MDLAAICEVLKATQLTEGDLRRAAEQKLDEASSDSPNQLIGALLAVLAKTDSSGGATPELRQEAAVILRQLVVGVGAKASVWDDLDLQTKVALKAQLLTTLECDPVGPTRRSAGQVVSEVCKTAAEDMESLVKEWPEVLPALARLISVGVETAKRVVGLNILKSLAATIGEGLLAQGGELLQLLSSTLTDQAAEIRAGGAQLLLQLVEQLDPDSVKPLVAAMPAVIAVVQGLANEMKEELLKETLQALSSAAEEEPDFFKDNNLQELWATLVKICGVGPEAFGDNEVRHSAMEVAMTLAVHIVDEIPAPQANALLEEIVGLNLAWMLEVEEDVAAWTTEGKETDEDDCDGDAVEIGEENMDRLAEKIDEEMLMPVLFKVIRASLQRPEADWKHTRSAIMAISQVIEHLEEEEAWVDQCIEFVGNHFKHQHPRVRYVAYWAVGQACYDHSPHVQEKHAALLVPAIVEGIADPNIRVAMQACSSFTPLAEELYPESLEDHLQDLLKILFQRLQAGESRTMQEHCLSSIATVAEVCEDEFAPYYTDVMPMLKHVIASATTEEQRSLRGKAFECVSLVGSVVGKEIFLPDARDVLEEMTRLCQKGFAADDPQRECVHEAAGKIAETLGKDFKPYAPGILPSIFAIIGQRPKELAPEEMPDEDDQEDMSLQIVGDKVLGLKTSVLSEMEDALDLLNKFIKALQEEFCDLMPATCQNLLPLLDFQLSEDLREKAFKTWEVMTESARAAVDCGRIDGAVLRELVTGFLTKTVGALAQGAPEADKVPSETVCGTLQAQAVGIAGVIEKAGAGVLTKDAVKDVAAVVVRLLSAIKCDSDTAESTRRRKGAPMPEEDEDGDEKSDDEVADATPQSLRFCLADVAQALMKVSKEDVAEVSLPSFMDLVGKLLANTANENDRSLGFYIADDIVECLGVHSVPCWDMFMNQALQGVVDKSAYVRQYATSTIGHGAEHAVFAPMAGAAASQVFNVLQKLGERHRRRRAVKADAKQTGLAVDAAIRTLGQILEHQEQTLGQHAGKAWDMWLSSLPIKYDAETGYKTHEQLLRLVARGHPILTAPENQAKVFGLLIEIYKSKRSNSALDKDIAAAVSQVGEEQLKQLAASMPEPKQKKIENMLKTAKSAAKGSPDMLGA